MSKHKIDGLDAPSREEAEHAEVVTELQMEHNRIIQLLQQRKARFAEREQGPAGTVRLQQEQAESATRLQQEQEGPVPWLKQEVAQFFKWLQQHHIISSQNILQELHNRIQKLQGALRGIKEQNHQGNDEVSLGLPQRNERARIEMEKDIALLQRKHAEITQRLEQEQTESKVLALFSVAGQDHFLFLKTHSKPGTKQFLLKKFWFLCATMPVPLKFDFIKKLLAFIDMECCRLAKIVRKKDKKRKFYSTTVTTEHSKRVNEHVMELAYNIKKEIQLEELNVTYLLYKKLIEFIQDMQQEIRNTISKVQIENNACFMELQKRKGKVVEIENKHVEIFRFPKEPEIPLRRLQEEQVEPVICLQENKFGSVPWLKQELARSAQRLQQ
ncbi:uncharacterized protein TNIN_16411 [Trichonephila inaurata madagascariensis]|uniref:Uncharacterized protein n=1 Tax=Trichonephila inaurata madagascariensis TaxID=2747483 RepID=A0A8X6XHT2_9ARAC|nr:uncharacterized protein TNIN_16411 [Trichonephila inaurata madagascariensis]